jgi:hypothetical protein
LSSNHIVEIDRWTEFLDLTSDEKIRAAAWPKDQWTVAGGNIFLGYDEVTRQDTPPEIIKHPQPRGLLGPFGPTEKPQIITQPSGQRAKNIKAYKKIILDHPINKEWLDKSDLFRRALILFTKARVTTKNGPLASEFAEFRFLRIVVMHIGSFLIAEQHAFKDIRANSKQRNQAAQHAAKLKILFSEGVRLRDWHKQQELSKLLLQLEAETSKAPRKEKMDATFSKRQCLEKLGINLLAELDLFTPNLVSEFAGMIDWMADSTTFERLVTRVRRYRNKAIADRKRAVAIDLIVDAVRNKPHITA